uniref:Protein cereblon n=1 Tax=Plectus sambesii TaxID=2011161 RepID=A0A914W5Q9_9BILA
MDDGDNQQQPIDEDANPENQLEELDDEADAEFVVIDDDDDTDEATSSTSSESSEEGGVNMGARQSRARCELITFNQNLPATHSYLGADLEDTGGGASWVEPGSILDNVPIFPVAGLILMPGQTLPLQSLHPHRISMFRRIIERHSMFAVLTLRGGPLDLMGDTMRQEMVNVGTLAQVVAFKESEDVLTTIKIRAVGRQRFMLVELKHTIDGGPCGKVRILPEICLGDALSCATPDSWQKFRLNKSFNRSQKRYIASCFTPTPSFVYRQNDAEVIKSQLVAELSQWYDPTRVAPLADNLVDFSFWVATNLPIDDDNKLFLLGINCTVQRLRCELYLIRQCEDLCCRSCSLRICKKRDVFSMSVDGPMGAYVNPSGHVHEMLTVYDVNHSGILSRGRSSIESSWFPGYAWTIQVCARCHAHMGWKFSAREDGLQPKKFWGLTRSAIWPMMREPTDDDAQADEQHAEAARDDVTHRPLRL